MVRLNFPLSELTSVVVTPIFVAIFVAPIMLYLGCKLAGRACKQIDDDGK